MLICNFGEERRTWGDITAGHRAKIAVRNSSCSTFCAPNTYHIMIASQQHILWEQRKLLESHENNMAEPLWDVVWIMFF